MWFNVPSPTTGDAVGMSPLSPESILDPNVDWKSKAMSWLLQQGVPTILLCSILAGVYFGRTEVIESIQSGYNQNAQDLKKAVDACVSQGQIMDKQFDRVCQQAEKREQLLIEVLRGKKPKEGTETP